MGEGAGWRLGPVTIISVMDRDKLPKFPILKGKKKKNKRGGRKSATL